MPGILYFCKQCGRVARFNEKPNYCYADRCDSIENVSDEDAVKMGVNIPDGKTFEFIRDAKWDPFTGGKIINCVPGRSLKDFQREIMEMVQS